MLGTQKCILRLFGDSLKKEKKPRCPVSRATDVIKLLAVAVTVFFQVSTKIEQGM